MNPFARIRRALCRHDWFTITNRWARERGTDMWCWRCGHVLKAEHPRERS